MIEPVSQNFGNLLGWQNIMHFTCNNIPVYIQFNDCYANVLRVMYGIDIKYKEKLRTWQIIGMHYLKRNTVFISLINTTFLISTPVQYYFNTNNIDIIIFISSAPSNSTTCHHATPGIMVNYRVMVTLSITFEFNK